MSTLTNGTKTTAPTGSPPGPEIWELSRKGAGWVVFASIMFIVSAALNAVWGIAAVSNSRFFVGDATYILSDLNTWGWIAIGFAALEVLAAISITAAGRSAAGSGSRWRASRSSRR